MTLQNVQKALNKGYKNKRITFQEKKLLKKKKRKEVKDHEKNHQKKMTLSMT